MNKLTIQQISDALKEAQDAANQAYSADDGGTSDMDSVVIDFKGWRQKKIDAVSQMSGVNISSPLSGFWKGCRFIDFNLRGQGNNRSRMAEAAKSKLIDLGVTAHMYYQMD